MWYIKSLISSQQSVNSSQCIKSSKKEITMVSVNCHSHYSHNVTGIRITYTCEKFSVY